MATDSSPAYIHTLTKNGHKFLCCLYPRPYKMMLQFLCQEVESISPPLECGLTLWLASANRNISKLQPEA